MIRPKSFFFLLFLVLVPLLLSGEKMWYRFSESQLTEEDWVINTRTQEGEVLILITETHEGSTTYHFRSDGEVIFQSGVGSNTDYTIERQNEQLWVRGTYEGQALNDRIDLGGRAWLGQVENAYLTMKAENQDKIFFSIIQPNDPTNLLDMELTIQGSQKIGQESVEKLRLNLSGFLALFWGCDFWLNQEGLLIRYQGDTGPGTPFMTVDYLRTES